MIFDALFFLGGSIIAIVTFPFTLLPTIGLTPITNAITWVFSYANYLQGIMPIYEMISAFGTFLLVWLFVYVVKIVIKLFAYIPWIGKDVEIIKHDRSK